MSIIFCEFIEVFNAPENLFVKRITIILQDVVMVKTNHDIIDNIYFIIQKHNISPINWTILSIFG